MTCFTRRFSYQLLPVAFSIVVLLSACAGPRQAHRRPRQAGVRPQSRSFLPVYDQVTHFVENHDFSGALSALQHGEAQFGNKDRLLYLMEGGLLSLYAHDYTTSRKALTEAELLDQDLYTRSLTRQATTFIINDLVAPYRGEDFESVMLNLLLALAYLQEGSVEDALVEARKVDKKLEAINSQYPKGKKNTYKEDAFVRWLMGMLYEIDPTSANLNDAFISYRKALNIYKNDYHTDYALGPPELLKKQYLRLAEWMGGEEFREAKHRVGDVKYMLQKDKDKRSTLTFIHFNGKSPIKVEKSITAPLPDGHIMKVAFPQYQDRPFTIVESTICASRADGKIFRTRSRLGEPVARIARTNLENREGRIMAKAIARAAAKYAGGKEMVEEAKERYGDWGEILAKTFVNVYIVVSEVADTRCWYSLPSQIRMGQLHVPPGTYALSADCLNRQRQIVEKVDLGAVTTEPGETRFFTFCTTK